MKINSLLGNADPILGFGIGTSTATTGAMFEFDIGGILFVAGIASGGQKFSTTDIFTASLNYR